MVKRGICEPSGGKELGKKKYKLTPHNPYINQKTGYIQVGSRLEFLPLKEDAKFPILLPKKDKNVKYLIHHIHCIEGHAGAKHVHTQILQKFLILQSLQIVEVEKSVKCQKRKKLPCKQKMARLPAERTEIGINPFLVTGIDCMGPFLVTQNGSRAHQKVWVLIFTCFASHAVHAEVLIDMTASSVINAIAKFPARHLGVRKFFSNNARNFTKANKLLDAEFRKCKREAIKK